MEHLIITGKLPRIPWGEGFRFRLEDLQRIAREGFTFEGKPVRPSHRRAAPAPGVGNRIRSIPVDP